MDLSIYIQTGLINILFSRNMPLEFMSCFLQIFLLFLKFFYIIENYLSIEDLGVSGFLGVSTHINYKS